MEAATVFNESENYRRMINCKFNSLYLYKLNFNMKFTFAKFLLLLIVFAKYFARHSKNYAILISTSLFYFNYRSDLNILLIYDQLKEHGFRDSEILMF